MVRVFPEISATEGLELVNTTDRFEEAVAARVNGVSPKVLAGRALNVRVCGEVPLDAVIVNVRVTASAGE
jgi:hypothetical protein